MKEIEVKAKINNFPKIRKNLFHLGCRFSKPMIQEDQIFISKNITFDQIAPGMNVLRIRKQKNKILVTLKQKTATVLAPHEVEFEVNDEKSVKDFFEKIGYQKIMDIVKKRIKCNFKNYEICYDEVEKLGNFIEIEEMSDKDSEKVQNKLLDFLLSVGVNKNDRVNKSYDTLIFEKFKGRL